MTAVRDDVREGASGGPADADATRRSSEVDRQREQALIEEARRRQRRRRARIAGTTVLVVAAAAAGYRLAHGGTAPPLRRAPTSLPSTPSGFIRSATAAAERTFAATYRVTGSHRGVVRVAQKVHPDPSDPGSGTWSFVFRSTSGISSQWIQQGSSSSDCWRPTADGAPWSCTGPGTYHQVSGFLLSTAPFVPSGVVSQLALLQEAFGHDGWVQHAEVSKRHSRHFGELRCLEVRAISLGAPVTMCIDRHGTMVRESDWPGGYFTDVSLVRRSATLPQGAFEPLSALQPGLLTVPQ